MEQYIGVAIVVAILYGAFKYYERRKVKKAARLTIGGNVKESLPPKNEL